MSSSSEGVIGVLDDNHVLRSSSSDGTVVLFSLVVSVGKSCGDDSHRRVSEGLGFSCVANMVDSCSVECFCCIEPECGVIEREEDDRELSVSLSGESVVATSFPFSLAGLDST